MCKLGYHLDSIDMKYLMCCLSRVHVDEQAQKTAEKEKLGLWAEGESIREGDGVISCLLGEPIWSFLRSGIGERAGGLERCLPGLLSPLSELAKPCKNWS